MSGRRRPPLLGEHRTLKKKGLRPGQQVLDLRILGEHRTLKKKGLRLRVMDDLLRDVREHRTLKKKGLRRMEPFSATYVAVSTAP